MVIVAIDDEMPALNLLLGTLKEVRPDDEIVGFSDPDDIIEYVENNKIDVACLDIQIYDTTGIIIAEKIKKLQPRVNIIFVTAFGDYVTDAMKMHASGYLRKPITAEDIRKELSDLRYEVIEESKKPILRVKCFGNFEVFDMEGNTIHFSRAKSKEAFAYLVCKNESSCTINEMGSEIFEDEPYDSKKKSYIQKIISTMNKDLESIGALAVIRKSYNSISIDIKRVDCDYYRYLLGEDSPETTYRGEFMNQYSWAEYYNDFSFV